MEITNIHEAKTHLSRLVERVAAGEEIVIAKAGKPVAKLVPYQEPSPPIRKPGSWRGKVKIKRGFDQLPDSIAAAFEESFREALLDTHVLLWWLAASERLSKTARKAVVDCPAVYVSAATIWEISIKHALGELQIPDDLEETLHANSFRPLPIGVAHAIAAGKLPRHHDDPFDRMLIAQASLESMTLLTSDSRLDAYDVSILPA